MAKFSFNVVPREAPIAETGHRAIRTKIPVPESLALLEEIKLHESSNALEQLLVVWDHAKNHKIFDQRYNTSINLSPSIFLENSSDGINRLT